MYSVLKQHISAQYIWHSNKVIMIIIIVIINIIIITIIIIIIIIKIIINVFDISS